MSISSSLTGFHSPGIGLNNAEWELSLSQRKERFIHEVNQLFENSLEVRKHSKIEQMKVIWSRNKLARFATGTGLAIGAVAATASGAFIVAGGLLGARAAIGAIGGYLLSDSVLIFLHSKITTDKYVQLLSAIQSAEKRSDLDNIIESIIADLEFDDFNTRIAQAENSKKRFQKTNTVISGTIAATFAIFGGISAAEAATESLSKSAEIINTTHEKALNILGNAPSNKINAINISDIFQDIQHDHPNQGYITLEQTIRRVEGLKMGIPLDDSSQLNSLNASVYNLVRDDNGPVIKTMKELGILTEGQSIDDIAPNLSKDQIQKITEKAYSLQEGPISNEYTGSTPVNINAIPNISNVSDSLPASPIVPQNDNPSLFSSWGWKILGVGAGLGTFLGIRGFIKKRQLLNKKNIPSKITPVTSDYRPQTQGTTEPLPPISLGGEKKQKSTLKEGGAEKIIPQDDKINIVPEDTTQKEVTASIPSTPVQKENISQVGPVKENEEVQDTQEKEEITKQEPLSKNAERFHRFKDAVTEEFGFAIDLKNSQITENGEKCIVFTKQSYCGSFKTMFIEDAFGKISIRCIWLDGIEEKYTDTHAVLSIEDTRSIFETMFRQALLERDIIKNKEFLELHTVEVTGDDLKSIYKQLEDPYVLTHGTETGGYWFQSCYGMKNGIMRLENLANPTLDEMELSATGFGVVGEKGSDYFARNKTHSLFQTFGTQEANILLKKQVNTYLQSEVKKTIIMDGAINYYNWHKHPGTLHHPSWLDINHMDMGRGRFESQPNLQVLTWGIVNELPKNSPINERNKPSNSIIFRSAEYQGSRDYIMYFWKIHRNKENKDYKIEDLIPLDVYIA